MIRGTRLSDKDFKAQVRIEAGIGRRRIPSEIADLVSAAFVQRDLATSEHVSLAIDLAQYFQGLVKKSPGRAWLFGENTPESSLSNRQMEVALQPRVEQIRLEYFGSGSVPFNSYDRAVEWIRREAEDRKDKAPDTERWRQLNVGVQSAIEQFPNTYALEWSLSAHSISLLKPKPGDLSPHVIFGRGTSLHKLNKFSEEMAEGTGCDPAICVAHVLAGAPLLLSPITFSTEMTVGCGLKWYSATINIPVPHAVTLKMLAETFRRVREGLGLSRKKTASEWHVRLVRLVETRGGVPQHDKTAFWEDIRRQWNKAVPKGKRRYTTWMGPKMAYDRIQARLKRSRNSQMGAAHGREVRKLTSFEKKAQAMALNEARRAIKEI